MEVDDELHSDFLLAIPCMQRNCAMAFSLPLGSLQSPDLIDAWCNENEAVFSPMQPQDGGPVRGGIFCLSCYEAIILSTSQMQ